MAKTNKNELKKEKKVKNVSAESKNITKEVKNVKQVEGKKAKTNNAGTPPVKAIEKPKVENSEANEALLAKLAKKNAKKIAQKLKKQQAIKDGKVIKKKAVKGENKQGNDGKKKNMGKKLTKNENDKPKINHQDPAVQAATIFVGNLPVNIKQSQIMQIFKQYGPIKTVRLRLANGSKIYKQKMRKEAGSLISYLVLESAEKAEKALALNNFEYKGNHLRVTRAAEKGGTDNKRTVVVGNLKYSANEEKLREIFSSCGEIEYIRCLQASPQDIAAATKKDVKAGCKGVAYVCFKSPEAVGLALELKDTMLDERPINVERYSNKKQGALQARLDIAKIVESANKSNKSKAGKKGKPNTNGDDESSDLKKKTIYHGVKIENVKKKKTKKADKKLKAVAKKIAPKAVISK